MSTFWETLKVGSCAEELRTVDFYLQPLPTVIKKLLQQSTKAHKSTLDTEARDPWGSGESDTREEHDF